MNSYSEKIFDTSEIILFGKATSLVAALRHDAELRCHELARAVARTLGSLRVFDGKFGSVDHSWCETEYMNVLDVYAAGSLPQVQLLHAGSRAWMLPHDKSYKVGEPRTDIREERLEALMNEIRQLSAPAMKGLSL
jgi:hypothetical protein